VNTLSARATYGALVYIFQWGNLGFPRVEFIDAIIPILLFCVLFGLSMDYEVFLLSRIREEWLESKDNRTAWQADWRRRCWRPPGPRRAATAP
jgi:RND superfamily putative drug exporter